MDTQDIRDLTQIEEPDKLFFLLVATPRNPPKTFHKKLVQPFLDLRGWEKISYRQTGFRALYFLHDKQEDVENTSFPNTSSSVECVRCKTGKDDEIPIKKSKPQKQIDLPCATSINACSICNEWTSLERATRDRDDLKTAIQNYKSKNGGSFEVHLILSKPVDEGEEFLKIASQPDAIE